LGREGLRRTDPDGGRPLFAWLRRQRALILSVELLFAVAFLGWTAFRAYNPDIAATEKPMEFAFINGVLGSDLFPPQDPWLSGYAISYYYFGYVMLGLLIRLTGTVSAVGFNLGMALWFALTLIGAFGVVYDMVSAARAADRGRAAPIGFGLLGALFVGVAGNLEAVVELAYHRRLVPEAWIRWLDIKNLADAPPSAEWPNQFWWWWRASRVIHDRSLAGDSVEVIDEFPFFSFLLGDLHPHVLGLPFVLLAIALALHVTLGGYGSPSGVAEGWRRRIPVIDLVGMGVPGLLLTAVLLGALGFLNTWDYPIYVALLAASVAVVAALRRGLSWGVIGGALLSGLVVAVVGWLAYLPFYVGFQSQFGGVLPNLLYPSRFSQFFVMFGPFLVAAAFFLWLLSRETPGWARSFLRTLPVALLTPILVAGIVMLGLLGLPQGQEYARGVLSDPAFQAAFGGNAPADLVAGAARLRIATPWTYLVLALLLAWAAGIWLAALRRPGDERPPHLRSVEDARRGATDLFTVTLIGLALVLTLSVEFVYLRDLFTTRMNTVFKFYYQAWIVLALAAAYGLSRLSARETPVWIKAPAIATVGALILAGLVYPLAATPEKADRFRGEPTLDGLAYLRNGNPADAAAVDWLRANVPPDAVVVEASGGSYSSEGAGRVSMSTGNPTLLGWDFHERQWRGDAYDEAVAGRIEALDAIYRYAGPEELQAVLDRWGARFVYVGALERGKYGMDDASLSRLDRALRRVYEGDGVIIYAR
jgi:YYY domain-containing protein